jgi:hypothetical protein
VPGLQGIASFTSCEHQVVGVAVIIWPASILLFLSLQAQAPGLDVVIQTGGIAVSQMVCRNTTRRNTQAEQFHNPGSILIINALLERPFRLTQSNPLRSFGRERLFGTLAIIMRSSWAKRESILTIVRD